MDIIQYLGKSKTLEEWVQECIQNPDQGYWLIFKELSDNEKISLKTQMFPITGNTGELSDEEFEELDNSINKNGYSNFLNLDQLEDIVSNLEMQKTKYTNMELMNSIEYYFENDAFINLNNG